MNRQTSLNGSDALFTLFPVMRRVIFEAFDRHNIKITRTQQIILITMYSSGTLSMSELARRITTSNEQATRAVTQLVAIDFIDRSQNEHNHRIVNVKLTDKAMAYIGEIGEIAEQILVECLGKESARKLSSGMVSAAKNIADKD